MTSGNQLPATFYCARCTRHKPLRDRVRPVAGSKRMCCIECKAKADAALNRIRELVAA